MRLMMREGRHIHLTEAGESLALVAHRSFNAIRHEVDRLTMRERLPITLAAMPLVMTSWIFPRLNSFRQAHPGVALHLSTIQSDQFVTPEPDVTILFSLSGDLPLHARPLIHGRALPVCSPDYLAARPIASDADVLRGTLLHDEDSRMWAEWAVRAGFEPPEPSTNGLVYLAGSNMLCDAVIMGHGIAICREALIREHLQAGRLIAVSTIAIDAQSCYYVIVSGEGGRSGTVTAVLRWLVGLSKATDLSPAPATADDF